jgi:alkanesulfonate monooxygenase SsuD/methylene tetrahydromethanopterin reductase-like flavin-dependent oxidoreductase (luciferase family)
LIGGGGEKVTLRIVAEHAHIWNGLSDPREASRKSKVLDGWCERVGRDPNEIERSVLIRPNRMKNADAYVENGITHLMLGFTGPDYDLSPLRELIAWRDSRNGG